MEHFDEPVFLVLSDWMVVEGEQFVHMTMKHATNIFFLFP